jgi:hypothetical protein
MNQVLTKDIAIPYKFTPRDYQLGMLTQVPKYYSRGAFLWHRRAGKDKAAWNKVIMEAIQHRAIYYYFFPTYRQGRKAIWEAIDPNTGVRFLDHIPPEFITNKNDTEMKVTLVNGSIIRIVGTEDIDSVVGTAPYGCIFSEYALQDPKAWNMIRPILAENKGWALFVSTPRGRNHFYNLFRMAQASPDWYTEVLTINDTKREDGTPVITPDDLNRERAEGMFEELIQQEYFVSFSGYIQGSYYSTQIETARNEKRICDLPYIPGHEVHTAWDIGYDDSTAIWFFQVINQQVRFIDYYENCMQDLSHYAKVLKERNNGAYVYGDHYLPHDVAVHDIQTGLTRKEFLENLGIRPITPVPKARNLDAVLSGIEGARAILPTCWFDKTRCALGLTALEAYHAEYDEEKKVLSNRPTHDSSSHASDSFRTFVVGFTPKKKRRSVTSMMDERIR